MAHTNYCGSAKRECFFKKEMYKLQQQIEQMKICGNCRNIRTEKCGECVMTMKYDNWELKESD